MADQSKITKQWRAFSNTEAFQDFVSYLDGLSDLYVKYGEERAMPGPDGKKYSIDDHTIAALLQGRRVSGMVKTYITSRSEADVAQPVKSK
jgi:hypothetical protein